MLAERKFIAIVRVAFGLGISFLIFKPDAFFLEGMVKIMLRLMLMLVLKVMMMVFKTHTIHLFLTFLLLINIKNFKAYNTINLHLDNIIDGSSRINPHTFGYNNKLFNNFCILGFVFKCFVCHFKLLFGNSLIFLIFTYFTQYLSLSRFLFEEEFLIYNLHSSSSLSENSKSKKCINSQSAETNQSNLTLEMI